MSSSLHDLLGALRPSRADAARNFDAIVTAARAEFTDHGTDASLDDIARRAGVGPATLYRNFPTRGDLVEVVYIAEVDSLCQEAERLLGHDDPWAALALWVEGFVSYMGTKRVLLDALDRRSGRFRAARDALYAAAEPLLVRAQAAGAARDDVSVDDLLRFVVGITGAPVRSPTQRDRILAMALAGLSAPTERRPSS